MPSSRSTNTMAEFLQRMLADISQAKTLADADLGFLVGLETTILQKLREPIDMMMGQMQGAQQGGMEGQAGMSSMPMIPMGGGMGGESPLPLPQQERVTGTRMEPNMPNMDEMRRMMGGAG